MAKFHYREAPSVTQKKSFKPYLSEDEDLVLATGLSEAYLRQQFIMYTLFPGIIFGVVGFGIGWLLGLEVGYSILIGLVFSLIASFLKTLHLYHANRYLFTTRRVIIKTGLFSVKLTTTLYDKITHIEVDQGFMDRILLHHGSIIINTAGMNKNEIVLKNVDYPMELKNLLERLINREREQFGLRPFSGSTIEGEIIS